MKAEFKDVDDSVFNVFKEWNEIIKNNNEQPTHNPLDIKYYIRDKWWKKLIPSFIYRILFKPDKIFKNCYPISIDFDYTQQPLSGSPDGSPKLPTATSDNGKRCVKFQN